MTDPAQSFADALLELEKSRDVDAFVAGQFADGATLARPETTQQVEGTDGANQFWTQYLDQFDQIATTFDRVRGEGSIGVLEWQSRGTLASGSPIDYRGVSLLDLDGDGRVTRFATYYDTAAFASRVDSGA